MTETVAKHIFTAPYLCGIPNFYCYSKEELEQIGVDSSWDPNVDRAIMREKRTVYLTIAQMVHFYDQGAPIELMRLGDSVTIYQKIKEHLNNWREVVAMVINAPEPPMDDLRRMDAFATSLYWIAARFNTGLVDTPSVFKNRVNRDYKRNVFRRTTQPEAVEVVNPGHTPIADIIARTNFKRRE